MEDEEQIKLPAVPATPVNKSVRLPVFWLTNIATWFASMKGIFELLISLPPTLPVELARELRILLSKADMAG
jgi:hypothetical protein